MRAGSVGDLLSVPAKEPDFVETKLPQLLDLGLRSDVVIQESGSVRRVIEDDMVLGLNAAKRFPVPEDEDDPADNPQRNVRDRAALSERKRLCRCVEVVR